MLDTPWLVEEKSTAICCFKPHIMADDIPENYQRTPKGLEVWMGIHLYVT